METIIEVDGQEYPQAELLARLEKLESNNLDVLRQSERRVILAELKVEAIRAGMVDLDGLKFLDVASVRLEDDGSLADGVDMINKLKHSKPWLFSTPSSSSIAKVPPSRPTRQKLATEMTDEEYQVARADIIRRSVL